MSIKKLREELQTTLEKRLQEILPGVYEFRFVKVVATADNLEYSYWVYMGARSDYLIIPMYFCSCKDFIIRTIINKTSLCCKHLLGVQLAIREKKHVTLNVSIEDSAQIIAELVDRYFSPTLRRLLYSKS